MKKIKCFEAALPEEHVCLCTTTCAHISLITLSTKASDFLFFLPLSAHLACLLTGLWKTNLQHALKVKTEATVFLSRCSKLKHTLSLIWVVPYMKRVKLQVHLRQKQTKVIVVLTFLFTILIILTSNTEKLKLEFGYIF